SKQAREPVQAASLPTLDRAERHSQPAGDRALAQVAVVGELDHCPLPLAQPCECAVEPERVDIGRQGERLNLLLDLRAGRWRRPQAGSHVDGRAARERQQPRGGASARRVVERCLAPDAREYLLLAVLALPPRDRATDGRDCSPIAVAQLLERRLAP